MNSFKLFRNNIIKSAKERIASGNYQELIKLHSVKPVDSIVIIGDKCLTAEDIYKYYETVAAIQENDNRKLGAVGELIDADMYNAMSEEQRERYVLKMATFYKSLSKEYRRRAEEKALEKAN